MISEKWTHYHVEFMSAKVLAYRGAIFEGCDRLP
jgi:hypothetical protein